MRRAFTTCLLAWGAVFVAMPAAATIRSFAYTQESRVLGPGQSELAPWTTFRVGQSRYYSALDGRLELQHGAVQRLQLALFWNFRTETRDVVSDSLTRELSRVTVSELASASAAIKYQLSDSAADLLGAALYFETTLGPRQSELAARVIVDRSMGAWLLAANAIGELALVPIRNAEGAQLDSALSLQPTLAVAYLLPHGASVGLELRAPWIVTGEAKSATLFGGPVARIADDGMWAALGLEPQLLAFSGSSEGSRLDLRHHQRLEVRLLAGFML